MIRYSHKNLSIKAFAILFLLSSFATSVLAKQGRYQPENYINVGLGFYANSGIYEGQADQFAPLPIIDIYLNKFIVRQNVVGYQVGWEMIAQKDFALFFGAQYDNTHLDVDSISAGSEGKFYGIDDRDKEWEIGLMMEYHSKVGLLEGHYFKGFNNDLETVGFLKMSRRLTQPESPLNITPGLFISYKSDEFNRYYYSVSEAENITGATIASRPLADYELFRPQYSPKNSGHFGADIEINYRFAKNLSFWGYLAVEDITGPVEMSPLVEEKSLYHLKAGILYSFGE